MEHSKRQISYYYDPKIGNYMYSNDHAMKPQRVKITHDLVMSYSLFEHMQIIRPHPATMNTLNTYHHPNYTEFLRKISEEPDQTYEESILETYGVGEDCPAFQNVFEFCQLSVGGSVSAAVALNKKTADIAINWMGGLHHAQKQKASGFCYTNDIVIGILELLKFHPRVLYVDIDVHHGDGVEEAFYHTNRVMTVSFHDYDGTFFPGTGQVKDIGADEGKLYCVNVPLKDGITDELYQSMFKPIMSKVMERFDPSVIVLQCGADSLNGDKLGAFNMTLKGHGECLTFLKSYNVPMMVLGGGGYTPLNVARCWTYETGLACNVELDNNIPDYENAFHFYSKPTLHIEAAKTMPNKNTSRSLSWALTKVLKNLSGIPAVPSVQMQPLSENTPVYVEEKKIKLEKASPDERLPQEIMDFVVKHEAEFYDGEEDSGIRDIQEYNALNQWTKWELLSIKEEFLTSDDFLVERVRIKIEASECKKELVDVKKEPKFVNEVKVKKEVEPEKEVRIKKEVEIKKEVVAEKKVEIKKEIIVKKEAEVHKDLKTEKKIDVKPIIEFKKDVEKKKEEEDIYEGMPVLSPDLPEAIDAINYDGMELEENTRVTRSKYNQFYENIVMPVLGRERPCNQTFNN